MIPPTLKSLRCRLSSLPSFTISCLTNTHAPLGPLTTSFPFSQAAPGVSHIKKKRKENNLDAWASQCNINNGFHLFLLLLPCQFFPVCLWRISPHAANEAFTFLFQLASRSLLPQMLSNAVLCIQADTPILIRTDRFHKTTMWHDKTGRKTDV